MKQILEQLGYAGSPKFFQNRKLDEVQGYAHVFRKALDICALQGVYVLHSDKENTSGTVPLVYVCEAQDDKEALRIHHKVWNQNIVPFLLVKSPRYLRLYKGFSYTHTHTPDKDPNTDIFKKVRLNDILSLTISAEDIEQGKIWEQWGSEIHPEERVDQTLLRALEKLGDWLTDHNMDMQTAHALIGKYIYLYYLRDREILSDRKLKNWRIDPKHVFTRSATLSAFNKVNRELDVWLNGSVFPVSDHVGDFQEDHIQKVAGVFFGDDVGGQLHLNFKAYDFSVIPTETLSSIYEQFLHATVSNTVASRGKKSGAHYTPSSLINFTIDELEQQKPLAEGMRVLDPSCGSGAFLVHCYRRLIEKRRSQGNSLTPHSLKQLLTQHIFGVELHEDACQVTALSLILTLLDNVKPPDLERKKDVNFKLPELLGSNIFHADFFDADSDWTRSNGSQIFDWVIGNPPWKKVKKNSQEEGEVHAWAWMNSSENKEHTATDNQLAEAFTWKVRDYLSDDGIVGLVLPAMTLTKQNPKFRKAFFSENRVLSIVNFSNLRMTLFSNEKSSTYAPAAIMCYKIGEPEPNDTILTYAPFAIDQIISRLSSRKNSWSFVINSSELQELNSRDVRDGSHLHWKVAMWGSQRDMKLIKKLQVKKLKRGFWDFREFCATHGLVVHEGFQLRNGKESSEKQEYLPELIGENILDIKKLRCIDRVFKFPAYSISNIPPEFANLRVRGGKKGLEVSNPPHIILSQARKFAIYSDEFIAVPPRQIGIGGTSDQTLLKALAAYLNSDFTIYHEFFVASAWGIRQGVSTLKSLLQLPVPSTLGEIKVRNKWASLYDKLMESSEDSRVPLLEQLNHTVFDALGLRDSEKILVEDLVDYRLKLLDGKIPNELLAAPKDKEIESYLDVFKRVLDTFVGEQYQHDIVAYLSEKVAVIQVCLFSGEHKIKPQIVHAGSKETDEFSDILNSLRKRHSQWLYFDRCLKVYEGSNMYVLKPLQRSQWLRSKALSDADDVIAEYLTIQG